MDAGATVEFRGVEIVRESTLAVCCRIREREYWIAPDRLLKGTTAAHFGDRGIMILARQFAEDRGLLLIQHSPLQQ